MLTGNSSEEILYQYCRFLQGDDTDQSAVGVIRKAIEDEVAVRTILKNYRKDGSIFWNELNHYGQTRSSQFTLGVLCSSKVLLPNTHVRREE